METKIEEILKKLSVELPYKWKIQTKPKADKKWACVAYIDSRDVQNILDKNCIWQNDFYESKGKLFCKIWIFTDDYWWIWRSDSWFLENNDIEDSTESKWEVSDTFKRAAVQWGIWRFLYSKKIEWVTLEEYNANRYNLTDYINNRSWNNPPKEQEQKPYFNQPEFTEFIKVKDKYKTADEALKTIRTKYRIGKSMEDSVRLEYISK